MTGAEIAEVMGMAETTVSGILTSSGLGKLGRLGLEPAVRYERCRPGELIHIDVKKLGRIARPGHRISGQRGRAVAGYHRKRYSLGWEFVHVCVDDATRFAYAEVLADEKATTAIAFLRRCLAHYRRHGVTVEAVLTDNGSAYRSAMHSIACRTLGLKHLRTRPYRPQTNGKAERSSARCSAAGLTGRSIAVRPSAPRLSRAGYGATTSSATTAPSAEGHRQLDLPS